jgi:hypothetical protein
MNAAPYALASRDRLKNRLLTEEDTLPKLLEQVRSQLGSRFYSLRTEQSCNYWIKPIIIIHNKRHPA